MFCIKILFVACREEFVSTRKTNGLVLLREIITVCCENSNSKIHYYTLWKFANFLNINSVMVTNFSVL